MSGGIIASAKAFIHDNPGTPAARIMAGLIAHADAAEKRRQTHQQQMLRAEERSAAVVSAYVAMGGIFDEEGVAIGARVDEPD